MPPVTSGEGDLERDGHFCLGRVWGRRDQGKRLFIKNTGPCEVVRRCIRTDSCPVLEG